LECNSQQNISYSTKEIMRDKISKFPLETTEKTKINSGKFAFDIAGNLFAVDNPTSISSKSGMLDMIMSKLQVCYLLLLILNK
jgi:hypothetical protein